MAMNYLGFKEVLGGFFLSQFRALRDHGVRDNLVDAEGEDENRATAV
jgi:hypothetical protein